MLPRMDKYLSGEQNCKLDDRRGDLTEMQKCPSLPSILTSILNIVTRMTAELALDQQELSADHLVWHSYLPIEITLTDQ